MYPGVGPVVLIRPAQTFYERITLGERSRLALSCSLELGDLLVQLFLGRRQLRNLPLQLRDQPHQLVALRGREVFGLTRSQSMKTCSVPHNPPTDADPANQSPLIERLSLSLRYSCFLSRNRYLVDCCDSDCQRDGEGLSPHF